MDFRVYDGFLDPVIIVTDDGYIQFANHSAERWLSISPGEVLRGKLIDECVRFHDGAILSSLPNLKPWEVAPYVQTAFDLPIHGYLNIAKVTAQCISLPPDLFLYALIIRDKVFVEALWEEDQAATKPKEATQTPEMPAPLAPPAQQFSGGPAGLSTAAPILDTSGLLKAMPKTPQARVNTRVVLNVPILKLNLKCQSVTVSEEWIDLMVKSPSIKPGMRCMMEVIGGSEIQPFTCAAFVDTYKLDNADIFLGRFKFDNLSSSARKIITSFVEKNSIKL